MPIPLPDAVAFEHEADNQFFGNQPVQIAATAVPEMPVGFIGEGFGGAIAGAVKIADAIPAGLFPFRQASEEACPGLEVKADSSLVIQ